MTISQGGSPRFALRGLGPQTGSVSALGCGVGCRRVTTSLGKSLRLALHGSEPQIGRVNALGYVGAELDAGE